ncbi:MAG: thiamine-monophosphate kinase [Planctomycetes bacterium]|nr:thiamine-monophosphate kinase [Planctomycetota bacterium]MCP4770797.1 thiamine-monophosphate kinase [Planctomycetota bacterium]MCP4861337.1 thiamine-monophosphate kinase [Planctomycetota bacterium]
MRENHLHRIFQDSSPRLKGVSGPGDDCAVLIPPAGRKLLQTVDQVIGGVHVELDAEPQLYAQKLLRRTISDLAAAGATPWAASWTIATPPQWSAARVRALAKAFLASAAEFKMAVAGGDCSQASVPVLTCTALGLANGRIPGRAGAKPGDVVLVSGKLGGAVRSGRHLCPEPRLAMGKALVEDYSPHAMMDLSDGLASDLPRILTASDCGADLDLEHLPLHAELPPERAGWESAVGEGEDYELLIVCSGRSAKRALQDCRFRGIGLTAVGRITDLGKLRWLHRGKVKRLKSRGWDYHWGSET